MTDIRFKCRKCQAKLVIAGSVAGYVVNCPHCGTELLIPRPSSPSPRRGILSEEEIEFLAKPGARAGSGS